MWWIYNEGCPPDAMQARAQVEELQKKESYWEELVWNNFSLPRLAMKFMIDDASGHCVEAPH